MNDLDIILGTCRELDNMVWDSALPLEKVRKAKLKLARRIASLRKDVKVMYLEKNNYGLIAPCLCVTEGGCKGCRRIQ